MKNRKIITILPICVLLLFSSCMKEWLEPKRDKTMVVITSLEDIQAMLDNTEIMNINMPSIGEFAADDYYLSQSLYNGISASASSLWQKNAHIWAYEIYEGQPSSHWNNPYQMIFYSNLALERLNVLSEKEKNSDKGKNIAGSAHFYRAWAYYQLAQIFTSIENPDFGEFGLPLRTQSNIEKPSSRSTVAATYDLILNDLEEAEKLLPNLPEVKTRPSRAAAFGLLAITHLQLGDYEKALNASNSALQIQNTLIDYKSLNAQSDYPFQQFNQEVIFHTTLFYGGAMTPEQIFIDTVIYNKFSPGDLRKKLFILSKDSNVGFKGSYNGNYLFFNGIAVDEMYLIRAECNARLNQGLEAVRDLNILLRTRFDQNEFQNITVSDNLLEFILLERRKQLMFRGRRWSDLKRLNREAAFAVTLSRNLDGKLYQLEPNSKRYVFPIPNDVIKLSGIPQNPR